ncbi:MAG: hypothetical protein M1836_005010 [Candelina mexicana]|nr:MAG: hypothetical protein M1836_005010 [Candelina mexicana]
MTVLVLQSLFVAILSLSSSAILLNSRSGTPSEHTQHLPRAFSRTVIPRGASDPDHIEIHCYDHGISSLPPITSSLALFLRQTFSNLSDLCYMNPIVNCGCRCVSGGIATNGKEWWKIECSGPSGDAIPWMNSEGACTSCHIMCICSTQEEWVASRSKLNPLAPDFVPGRSELDPFAPEFIPGKGTRKVYCLDGTKGWCGGDGSCEKVGEEMRKGTVGEVLWGFAKEVVIGGLGICKD